MGLVMRGWLLIAVMGVLSGTAWADGKFFVVRESVPADVPYQRAFLLFHQGCETLILQSKYDLGKSAAVDSLGWVVPVPTVPEIASADPAVASQCFWLAAWRTQPDLDRISSRLAVIPLAMFLGGFAFLLFCAVQYPFVCRTPVAKAAWSRRSRNGTIVTIVGFLLTGTMFTPHLGHTIAGVDIVKAEQAGIYDVKVIRGDNAEAITAWLKGNGFGFQDDDARTFRDYVDRGWCFVAAKIDPNRPAGSEEVAAEGMAAPLILKFASERPVYPLALTATIGTETEILIYSLSDNKLTCGGRLGLRHAREARARDTLDLLVGITQVEGRTLFNDLPETPMMLCKFKGRLTADQMREDLVFEAAADNEPYRERLIIW